MKMPDGSLRIVIGFLLSFCLLVTCGQALPCIEWQKCLGGIGNDQAYSVQQTSDGGYIAAGNTVSNNGDVSGNHGRADLWVVKLDPSGSLVWQRCLGGSNDEGALCIQQAHDGGYVIAGGTKSDYSGNVSGNHGSVDAWVVLLDASGNLVWQRCLGGSSNDYAQSIQPTADGGYVAAGYTASNNGDVSGNHGRADFWMVKLDSSGNLIWQRCLGGSDNEVAQSIRPTSDGGYILAGWTRSNDGNVSSNRGSMDGWIVKVDSSGNPVWQKCLGGSGDDSAQSIQPTADGGYILAGWTYSDDGDVSGNHGLMDGWIAKLDSSGNLVWQRCLGAYPGDDAASIQQVAGGGYIIAATTQSNGGDVSGNHGSHDYWAVLLDSSGSLVWQKCLGGRGSDIAYSVQQTSDGGYIVAGFSSSNEGDVSGNHGNYDFWVVKLREIDCTITAPDIVCSGSKGNAASTAASGAAYAWSITNGTITSPGDARSITFTAGSNRTATLAVSVTAGACTRECIKEITVTRRPDCSWNSSAPVCEGTKVQFSGPSGMDSYSWNFGDGSICKEQSPSHVYAAAGSYGVVLTVTKGGCTRTCNGSVTVKLWTSNSPVCIGTPVQFDGPAGMDRYLWTFGDGSGSRAEDPGHAYRKARTYAVRLIAVKGKVSKRSQENVIVKPMSGCS